MKITGIKILKRFRINAIVIYPFIFYADTEIDPVLNNHERIHWDQIKRDGVIFFYKRYFQEYLKLRCSGLKHDPAYRGISYEKEAYLHEKNLSYSVTARTKLF